MDALNTAHEFGADTALSGQGPLDSETGPSTAEVVQAVRDHSSNAVQTTAASIVAQWVAGYESVKVA